MLEPRPGVGKWLNEPGDHRGLDTGPARRLARPRRAARARCAGHRGLSTTLASIVLSVIPAPDEPNQALAMLKVVGGTLLLVAAGVVTYVAGHRKAGQH